MSKKAAEEFLKRLEKDVDFRVKLLKAKSPKERKTVMVDAGFDFSEKEVLAVLEKNYQIRFTKEQLEEAAEESQFANLSDKELRKVAGGVGLEAAKKVLPDAIAFTELRG